jgi:glucokinase|tara:strand:+ start:690 stop:1592 length:903 start_codon:yes stop_codon:yes gene_type:complete
MNKLLLIDIGGTNMRYATAYSDSDEISSINKKAFNETTFYENLEELIKEHNINTLIMSVAGPKIDNSITMTNKNFSFNQDNIKEKFKLKECYLLNDWESIAHSYSYIKESIKIIQDGKTYNNNLLFFGPGTGLGAAFSMNEVVLPTELGNTKNFIESLKKNFKNVTFEASRLEDIISGSGISKIYETLTHEKLSAEDIFEKFLDKEPDALFVINGFIKSLSQTLSDLTLSFLPGKGILLAGSLSRSIYTHFNEQNFFKPFINNNTGMHFDILKNTPIGVITKERTPLYGNLAFYKNLNKI